MINIMENIPGSPEDYLFEIGNECSEEFLARELAKVDHGLDLFHGHPALLNSKGIILQHLDQVEDALACFQAALEYTPNYQTARLNLALTQLKLGNFTEGWKNYEARWAPQCLKNPDAPRPWRELPLWLGEVGQYQPPNNKQRLLVTHEQGYGDSIQFARFVPLLAQHFAAVGLYINKSLFRLTEFSFAEQSFIYSTIRGNLADWDCYCPLLSLPLALNIQFDNIPANVPYLHATPAAKLFWQRRIQQNNPRPLKVGVSWLCGQDNLQDRRNFPFELLGKLMQNFSEQITWVSLQKLPEQHPNLHIPHGVHWLDWSTEWDDFADTAALTANLDLVIAIDSVIAHLAGALGIKTILLNRFDSEWRWFQQRTVPQGSPWYPGMRILRQNELGNWHSVLQELVLTMESSLPVHRAIVA